MSYFLPFTAKTTVGKNGGKRCGGHAAPFSGNAGRPRAGTASSYGGKGTEPNLNYFGGFPLIKTNCFLIYAYSLEKVETLHVFTLYR